MLLLENSFKEFYMKNSLFPPIHLDSGHPADVPAIKHPNNRHTPEIEMWRDAYVKEYHSHMLTFKVLRQAEYDLECAKKELELLRKELSRLDTGIERSENAA